MYKPGRIVSIVPRFGKWMARISLDFDTQKDVCSFFREFTNEPTEVEILQVAEQVCEDRNTPQDEELD